MNQLKHTKMNTPIQWPSSHKLVVNGNRVTLCLSSGKELLTLDSPKWNGTGSLLTYMIKVRMAQMTSKDFDITQY